MKVLELQKAQAFRGTRFPRPPPTTRDTTVGPREAPGPVLCLGTSSLPRNQGLSTWKVHSRRGSWTLETFQEQWPRLTGWDTPLGERRHREPPGHVGVEQSGQASWERQRLPTPRTSDAPRVPSPFPSLLLFLPVFLYIFHTVNY